MALFIISIVISSHTSDLTYETRLAHPALGLEDDHQTWQWYHTDGPA
jgi:hypothetical protein